MSSLIPSLIPIGDADWTTGREGNTPKYIVLHTVVGTEGSADRAFHTPNAGKSAHRIVGLDGNIHVEVSDGDTSWGAGNWFVNVRGFNLEHEDNGNYNDSVRTPELYNASSWQVADWCRRFGIPCKLVGVDANHNPLEPGIVVHKQVDTIAGGTGCPDGLDVSRIVTGAQAILGGEAITIEAVAAQVAVPPGIVPIDVEVLVNQPTLRVHNSPDLTDAGNFANTPDGMLHFDDTFHAKGYVRGVDPYSDGRNIWLQSDYGHWCWAGDTNFVPPATAVPEPTPVAQTAVVTSDAPEWESSFVAAPQTLTVQTATVAHDMENKEPDKMVAAGTQWNQGGTFSVDGVAYSRTQYGVDHGTWFGLPLSAFDSPAPEAPAEPAAPTVDAPVTVEAAKAVQVNDVTPKTASFDPTTTAPAVTSKSTIFTKLAALLGKLVALIKHKKDK